MYQSSGEASRCAVGSEHHDTGDDGSGDGELGDAGRGGVWVLRGCCQTNSNASPFAAEPSFQIALSWRHSSKRPCQFELNFNLSALRFLISAANSGPNLFHQ